MWNDDAQLVPRERLRSIQEERLKALVSRLYDKVPFYSDRLDKHGVRPRDIRSLEDIALLPFTSKEEMREVFPFGLLATDKSNIVEVHMSSGTTGKSVVGAYTKTDISTWADVMARTLDMGGVNKGDVVQNSYGYGLFTGGFGVHYGAGALGAMVLPVSSGNTLRQIQLMRDFGTTVITCTPSYALYMAEWAKEHDIDISALNLRVGFFGAEPWSEGMRLDIESKLGVKAFDIYGLTEIIGPGVGSECSFQNGLHIFEDHFYPEIIDPETGRVLPPGERGELVLSTLTREGTPVLRYRTRDITYLMDEPCPCGRTSRRIHRLMGRNDDMLIIRGVNVFPAQVEEVLLRIQGVEPHYRLIVDRRGAMDSLDVEVEMSESLFSDEVKVLMALERKIEHELKAALNIQTKVTLVNPKSIPRSEGKAQRVVDRRSLSSRD